MLQRLLLLSIFCFSLSQSVFSQDKASLTIINSTPEGKASLKIVRLPDSISVFKGILEDSLTVQLPINTQYFLSLTQTGKLPATQFILLDADRTVYLALIAEASELENVVVVARRPLVTMQDDKEIVDAEALAAGSTNAFEVLEKTPGAIIDQDGNVYLSSTSPATVFINGRQLKLSSSDISSLLKSLPANSIQKIEILRSPSAKYDANSSGGIVNIVLKKGVKLGLNGSVNVSSFQGVKNTSSIGFSINNSSGKWNTYGSAQYSKSNNFQELVTYRELVASQTQLEQNAFTTYPGGNVYLSGGVDYQVNKKLNLTYDASVSSNNGESSTTNSNLITRKGTGAIVTDSRNDINNDNRTAYFSSGLSGKYKIDSVGSEFIAEVTYNNYDGRTLQTYNNQFAVPSQPSLLGNGRADNNKSNLTFQGDLTYKLPRKYTLELGFKINSSNSDNATAYFKQLGNNPKTVDSFQTNTFQYRERISATYAQLAKTFFGFTLKPGLRLETTDIKGRQIIPSDTTFSIKRTDLFPYVYLSHKLFKIFEKDLIANAIYRRSISRPFYENLNPFPRYVDQFLYEVGNPSLRPQFTTNYEFNVTFSGFPVLGFGMNETKDIFSSVTYLDQVTKIAFRTYDNLGKNKEYYFRVVGGIPPGGRFFFYAGARHNFNEYEGFYQNQPLNYKRGSWVFFTYQEFKINNNLNVNAQAFMRTKGLQDLYELENFGGVYLSVNKTLLQKKLALSLSVRDAFYTNPVRFSINQADVIASGSRAGDTRRVGLKLRYNFGVRKDKKENKSFGAPVEGNVN